MPSRAACVSPGVGGTKIGMPSPPRRQLWCGYQPKEVRACVGRVCTYCRRLMPKACPAFIQILDHIVPDPMCVYVCRLCCHGVSTLSPVQSPLCIQLPGLHEGFVIYWIRYRTCRSGILECTRSKTTHPVACNTKTGRALVSPHGMSPNAGPCQAPK